MKDTISTLCDHFRTLWPEIQTHVPASSAINEEL